MVSGHPARTNDGRRRATQRGARAAVASSVFAAAAVCAATIFEAAGAAAAPKLTILHRFAPGEGSSPSTGLTFDKAGNLYGGAQYGVRWGDTGAIFKLAPDKTLTVLYSFTPAEGGWPVGALTVDDAGNVYGTAQGQGAAAGMVFKLAPDGTETVLHNFWRYRFSRPKSNLIFDAAGNIYGATSNYAGDDKRGAVFRLAPSGSLINAHIFTGADGAEPTGSIVADRDGNLYGTTQNGGAAGLGVIFKLTPKRVFSVLHSFAGDDGAYPYGLTMDAAGVLYGTTSGGGDGRGVAYRLSPDGVFTVLHVFPSKDGPFLSPGPMIVDKAGALFGSTCQGGEPHMGTLFRIAPDGIFTTLHTFAGTDGWCPAGALAVDAAGDLYGAGGGGSGSGVIFKLAGSGYANATPFRAFSGRLQISLGTAPALDSFTLNSSVSLGSRSDGVNPVAEQVTVVVGKAVVVIPPKSFGLYKTGFFHFRGVVGGVSLNAVIKPTGALRYAVVVEAQGVDLKGTANPVPVTLTIGADTGTASIKAAGVDVADSRTD